MQKQYDLFADSKSPVNQRVLVIRRGNVLGETA